MSSTEKCCSCSRRFQTCDSVPRVLLCHHLICSACLDDLLAPTEDVPHCPKCDHQLDPDCFVLKDVPVSAAVLRWLNAIPQGDKMVEEEQELTAGSVLAGSGSEGLPALLHLKSQDLTSLVEESGELLASMAGAGGRIRDKIKEHKKQQRLLRKGLSTLHSMEPELRSPTTAAQLSAVVQEVSDAAVQHEEALQQAQKQRGRDKVIDAEEVRLITARTRGCYAVFRYPQHSATESDSDDECHYAKLVIDREYLLMSALVKRDEPPSDLVEHFVHSDLMRTIAPAGCLVYLDLGQGGRMEGRVYIKLEKDTVWSRHFLAMCAGQNRVSYRGTTFTVFDAGKQGERLDSVLPHSLVNETIPIVDKTLPHAATMDIEAALVVGKGTTTPGFVCPRSPFSVYLRHWTNYENVNTIGRVVAGLALLKGSVTAKEPLNVQDTGVLLNTIV